MKRPLVPALFALLVALCAGPMVHAQEPPPRPKRSEMIRQRLRDDPNNPTLYYFLAVFEAREDNKAGSIEALEEVLRRGKGFLPARGIGFEAIWDDPQFQDVRSRMEKALPRVVDATELFRLDRNLLPEGITFDPESRSYFVGSVAQQKIVRVDSTGAVSDFSRPGELRHVLGLSLDPARHRLYAVSTSALTEAGEKDSINEVVAYDLRTGQRERAFHVGAAVQLNDVVAGPGNDLYTTDSGGGAVYHITSDGAVDTLAARGSVPGANGLALSPDGSALYVAHSSGVARFDLATRERLPRLELPPGEGIGAIDGLYADGEGVLIGIQNVTNPGRVIRMRLRRDGKGVESIETLLSHHHEAIDEPTTGVIVGRAFALLARTQVSRFTPQGTVESPETVKEPVVLRIELGPGEQ